MYRCSLPLAALMLSFTAATPAGAASFDCTKAATPDENAVCNTPELSQLDSEMGALWFTYRGMPSPTDGSNARQDESQAFVKRRGECGGDVVCLRAAYKARIKALQDGITRWLQENADLASAEQWSAPTTPHAILAVAEDHAA